MCTVESWMEVAISFWKHAMTTPPGYHMYRGGQTSQRRPDQPLAQAITARLLRLQPT
eukprot:m.324179 g.324179  ORF g.324179 m.324179 type:complete len:57 (+) comp27629_c0_seq9:5353-5523(+)